MGMHYGIVPENIDEIADAFGFSEEVLIAESVRVFVQNHLESLKAERKAIFTKYRVTTIEELAELIQPGEGAADDNPEELQRVGYLADRIRRITALLDDLPETPHSPQLDLDRIRAILKAQQPLLSESYGVKVLGIFGPYATGKPRPYDKVGVLVKLQKPMCFDFFGLQTELSRILGAPVLLATENAAWPGRIERIMSELVAV